MNLFRTLVVALLLSVGVPALAAENGSGDPRYTIQNPPAYAMLGDLLIARPLLVAATVIGAGGVCGVVAVYRVRWRHWRCGAGVGGRSGESRICAVPGVYRGGV